MQVSIRYSFLSSGDLANAVTCYEQWLRVDKRPFSMLEAGFLALD